MLKLNVKKLSETCHIPTKATQNDAGFDLYADEEITIPAGERRTVSTGIAFDMSVATKDLTDLSSDSMNIYMRIAPRSGLSAKNGINVLAGVVDPSYTGEVKVVLHNTGTEDFVISHGDRIAQAIPTAYYLCE